MKTNKKLATSTFCKNVVNYIICSCSITQKLLNLFIKQRQEKIWFTCLVWFVLIPKLELVLTLHLWLQIWNSGLAGYDKIHFRVKFLVFKLGLIRTVRPNLPWTVHQNSFLYMKIGNIENMREPLEPRSDLKNCSNRKLVQL